MKLNILLGGLDNPNPAVRLDVVRVLGMLDEVQALEPLRQRYQSEADPAVRNAIAWAGKRLFEAQQAGYSTIDELFRHFGIDREIENTPDAAEVEAMKKLQDSMDADLRRMQERSNSRRIGMAVAAGLGGSLLGGATMGMSAAMGAMMPGANAASSGMDGRPQIGTRTPAMAPSSQDITVWVRRLREDAIAARREQATIELSQLNNPAALPFLAAAFVSDPAVNVRQAAQRFGKIIYWSAIYWEMEQDGSLVEAMSKRAQAMGKNLPKQPGMPTPGTTTAATPGTSSAPEGDVTDILRKAQAARSKRQKKL